MEPIPESSADYVLVPREPTAEMKIAGDNAGWWCGDKWRAMLAAAPKPDPVHLAVNRQDAAPGWMPVSERLPANHQWDDDAPRFVLGYSTWADWQGSQVIVIDTADFYTPREDEDDLGTDESRCVTHWMPLPPPPVETGDKT